MHARLFAVETVELKYLVRIRLSLTTLEPFQARGESSMRRHRWLFCLGAERWSFRKISAFSSRTASPDIYR